jgi:hypothetical protein
VEASTGMGWIGFDPASGRFTSCWIDSNSTRMSLRQSQGRFDGERIELSGAGLAGGEPARASRTVSELQDGDRRLVHRQWSLNPDGTERLVLELVMTRRD